MILRDADGFVTVVVRDALDAIQLSNFSSELEAKLGMYAAKPCLATPAELYDCSLEDKSLDRFEFVVSEGVSDGIFIRYRERRIVGGDWVRDIQQPIENAPKVVVFSSLKGGVGRSTALSVAAVHLAAAGKSVLAIDLDLEAPGIGGMFLEKTALPLYGALDFYVEFGRTEIDSDFLNSMQEDVFSSASGGCFTIVPAAGRACIAYPQNVLGKISRAYLEVVDENGKPLTFLDKTRELVSRLCELRKYDVVFVDARAGLNESTAATVQGLGADVLFFGVDTAQTWDGYRYFFSHLARHKSEASDQADWRYKIKIVHAKASPNENSLKKFRDQAADLFGDYLYDEIDGDESAGGLTEAFGFDLDDATAPHYAWPIFVAPEFYEYDPLNVELKQNDPAVIEPSFGIFIDKLCERLELQ
ncbi:KGGVGR-motif variant AAA ATPase [Pseudomonas sp. MLB6B]